MLFTLDQVTKVFKTKKSSITALDAISLKFTAGDFVALCGPSGSGKTTLLNVIGGLEKPTSGKIILDDQELSSLKPKQKADLRFSEIGFIFQDFKLMPALNITENIELGMTIGARKLQRNKKQIKEETDHIIDVLGLRPWVSHRPDELSAGQKQRVAIARALVKRPTLILADEPTANLDDENSLQIIQIMKKLNDTLESICIISTHDARIISSCEQLLMIDEGRIDEGRSSFNR